MPRPFHNLRLPGVGLPRLLGAAVAVLLVSAVAGVESGAGSAAMGTSSGLRTISYHGYQVRVPSQWRVVDLASARHACVRFDRPAVYLGQVGDQRACPSHLIGGAPGLLVQPLNARSAAQVTPSTAVVARRGAIRSGRLPGTGPVSIALEGAGVLVTAVYGERSAHVAERVLASGRVLASARPVTLKSLPGSAKAAAAGANAPGNYHGPGFDACTAPSQGAMNAWHASSAYRAVGVYIGGVSRGCAQPNLTAAWVSQQVKRRWHLIPTYVGRQAPCSGYYNRMSYDPRTARAQGRAEAVDAVAKARALAMAAPSTVYSDVEGYNNTNASCVAAVLSYVSGWTQGLHAHGYQAGVYSSGSSGMHDLSASYGSSAYDRPDDIWIAWWNDLADVDGGSYVAKSQWRSHQRIHQYVGAVNESYGGYSIQIDRDYLDVGGAATHRLEGCPTNLDFAAYPVLRLGDRGDRVRAVQCQLARRGFDLARATGIVGKRSAAAISAFNTSRGLPARGTVFRRTWTALLSSGTTPALAQGATGRAVTRLQRSLTASLKRTVVITGTFGRSTRSAVLDYQTAHHLVADGVVGTRTWRALQAGH